MKKARIIVVEDEPLIGLEIKKNLDSVGYKVLDLVTSGEEAVKLAEKKKPDLILMDINLSGKMDGIEATMLIQKKSDIPVIYLTAYSYGEIFEKAKNTNPYGYLVKPGGRYNLFAAVEMALQRYRLENELKKKNSELVDLTKKNEEVNMNLNRANDMLIITQKDLLTVNENQSRNDEKWLSVMENLPHLITIVDSEGIISYMNRLFNGKKKETQIGTEIYKLLPKDIKGKLSEDIARVFKSGKSVRYKPSNITFINRNYYIQMLSPVKQKGRIVSVSILSSEIVD